MGYVPGDEDSLLGPQDALPRLRRRRRARRVSSVLRRVSFLEPTFASANCECLVLRVFPRTASVLCELFTVILLPPFARLTVVYISDCRYSRRL
jgi:hypothetical protein